jgi:hypothetical protein
VLLLVGGMLKAGDAAPAKIAVGAETIGASRATAPSIERRVRRIENDPRLTPETCFHPLARAYLRLGNPRELTLVVDPTTQDERMVMVAIGVWNRGRTLPLAWSVWPGQIPLNPQNDSEDDSEDDSENPEVRDFWRRVAELISEVKTLLPIGVQDVTILADRAFGCPAFIDLILPVNQTREGKSITNSSSSSLPRWHYIVRVQDQTRCRDRTGKEFSIRSLVRLPHQHVKLRGEVFKKRGWRTASVVVYWGRRYKDPLCLVSDLRPQWSLVALYRHRYGIEASFRDLKSHGWHWEQGRCHLRQVAWVRDLAHIRNLLVGIALATWLTICAGARAVEAFLERAVRSCRRTAGPESKLSLFAHGRLAFEHHWTGRTPLKLLCPIRTPDETDADDWPDATSVSSFHWEVACSWQQQITNAYGKAYVFAQHIETVRP